MQSKLQFRKVSKHFKCGIHRMSNVGNDGLNYCCLACTGRNATVVERHTQAHAACLVFVLASDSV